MPQKVVGASVSILLFSFLFGLFLLIPVMSRFYDIQNVAVLDCLEERIEDTCAVMPVQYLRHNLDDDPWGTKAPARQRLWKPNAININIFRLITVASVRRAYPYVQGHWKQIQDQKQKENQDPFPSLQNSQPEGSLKTCHTSLPRYEYVNKNDNTNNNEQRPPSRRRVVPRLSQPDIKNNCPLPIRTPQHFSQHSLYKSNNTLSSPIGLEYPNAASAHQRTRKEISLFGFPPFLTRAVQRYYRYHARRLSSTTDKPLGSQISSSRSSASHPLRTTGNRITSREKEMRGSFLGMVVCVVVGVMWI
ncbi:hypothetical protein ACJ72_00253 [Emergomyces africanus]|uniref:Uncharacterized protein n=1 Tax=Emergomyces africanus TaxID=1955775 RepID=A0A1B7P8K9_9EURO|nr:hypothetical protein ACJ72_00253 [Emergomyces africanus]